MRRVPTFVPWGDTWVELPEDEPEHDETCTLAPCCCRLSVEPDGEPEEDDFSEGD